MTRLAVAGVILALVLTPGAALSQSDSRIGAPPVPGTAIPMPPMMRQMPPPRGVAPVMQRGPSGRWSQVPGGWNAYRQPSYGYALPQHWVSTPYFISNYSLYRLPRPAAGFGWSRYYDDAVLTDRYGRVYDWRGNMDWSRDPRWASEDYSDSYGYRDDPRNDGPRPRRNDGVAGAVIGGVVGGIAGNIIGGDGNRLAGTLIGGGVGALAGQAIDKSSSRRRDRDRDHSYRDGGPSYPHWYRGEADGRYGWMEGPTVTTTTTTPGKPYVTKTVRYVTEYVTVPARRTKYVKRSKYVPL